MKDTIARFAAATRGMPVSHVWRGHGSALFIQFGILTPRARRDGGPGQPQGEIELMIQWSWRIEEQRSILCGSWSDEELWEPSFARLLGRQVENIATFGRLPELMLSLSGGLHVSSFMTAEGDPAWTLIDRRGPITITADCRSGVIVDREESSASG
ncbi:MAG: hypothetical protein HEQ16_03125 [Bosea sp.]|jgi:hypothetical protein|nr:hypothetical protein [Bosea sp. (in: a-proteobacteria)]